VDEFYLPRFHTLFTYIYSLEDEKSNFISVPRGRYFFLIKIKVFFSLEHNVVVHYLANR